MRHRIPTLAWPSRRPWRLAAGLLVLLAAACQHAEAPPPDAADQARAEPETAAVRTAPRQAVTAEKQMVVAAHPRAAEAGRRILRAGGSAVDAAIAAQMMLNLVEPQSSGIGGGGFMLHYGAADGGLAAYDGRETAPASAGPAMFVDAAGEPRPFQDVFTGGLPVGVPGLLRMLEMAHREHGRLPWADLFQPAIEAAREGFKVTQRMHRLISRAEGLQAFGPAADYLLDAEGRAKAPGTPVTNPAFARTLETIARNGADAFYMGAIAEDIAEAVAEAPRNPARMTVADLRGYTPKKRDPVCLFYRVWLVCGMPPPSSGGVTTLQILGLLQDRDLSALPPNGPEAVHLVAEASRLAFADRNTYIADPDVIPVPVSGMLDPGYLALRAEKISAERSMGEAQPGMPGIGAAQRRPAGDGGHGLSTTHLSVIDKDGNAVSLTSSINMAFGSRLMVDGFLLNNHLTDFDFAPERHGAPLANRAAAGKRPRSSMAPTLVLDGSGKVVMATGSPGGSRIIGYVAQSLIAALDWDMDIQRIAEQPHFVNRNGPTELEEETPITDLAPALETKGHTVRIAPMTSGLHAIRVRDGTLRGGADPRRDGVALGD